MMKKDNSHFSNCMPVLTRKFHKHATKRKQPVFFQYKRHITWSFSAFRSWSSCASNSDHLVSWDKPNRVGSRDLAQSATPLKVVPKNGPMDQWTLEKMGRNSWIQPFPGWKGVSTLAFWGWIKASCHSFYNSTTAAIHKKTIEAHKILLMVRKSGVHQWIWRIYHSQGSQGSQVVQDLNHQQYPLDQYPKGQATIQESKLYHHGGVLLQDAKTCLGRMNRSFFGKKTQLIHSLLVF